MIELTRRQGVSAPGLILAGLEVGQEDRCLGEESAIFARTQD